MYLVVRRYGGQGASQLIDELERRQADVEQVIRPVPGFMYYTLVRTDDGGMSITVCQDKAGADESSRRAAEWIRQNISTPGLAAPQITGGTVVFRFG